MGISSNVVKFPLAVNIPQPHTVMRVITLEGDKVIENHCEYAHHEEVHYLAQGYDDVLD
jgi:hypothetical protein